MNTGPDNFLRHAFKIEIDSPEWLKIERIFSQLDDIDGHSCDRQNSQQDRRLEPTQSASPTHWSQLVNEPDTDFSLVQNSAWAADIIRQWQPRCDAHATTVPQSLGQDVEGAGPQVDSFDPSRPGVVVARYRQADRHQITQALHCVVLIHPAGTVCRHQRHQLLRLAAQQIRLRQSLDGVFS